jgi:hypothetical protein
VTTAILASATYSVIAILGKNSVSFFPVTLISVLVAFVFRVFAVKDHWPQIVPFQAPAEGPKAAA